MAGTVQGREVGVNLYDASTFGEITGVTSGEKAYYRTCEIVGQRGLETDDTMSGNRGRQRPVKGNMNPSGAFNVHIAPASILRPLRYLVGSGTTYRPTTRDGSSITGVTVLRASEGSATGQGSLAFTATGTTLAWTENGDTAGSAVDVSGGGEFEIQTGTGEILYVDVDAGSLPGTDETDNVTVVDAYEHVFRVSDGIPEAGMIIEKDFGSKISAADRYEHIMGVKFGQGSFEISPSGFTPLNLTATAADVKIDNGAALDSTPTDPGHKAFDNAVASIKEGGSTIGVVTQLTQNIGNDLDEDTFVIGGGGVRASLDEGMIDVTGQMTFLMQDRALTKKGVDLTESSLVTEWSNGTGDGTDGNEYLALELDKMVYELGTEPISGPRGIRHQLSYQGFRESGEIGYRVILRNQRSSLTL